MYYLDKIYYYFDSILIKIWYKIIVHHLVFIIKTRFLNENKSIFDIEIYFKIFS